MQVIHTVKVTSHTSSACPYCTEHLRGEDTDDCINHLIEVHGGTLLHVGSEGSVDGEMNTVAVLGFADKPKPKSTSVPNLTFKLNP